MAERVTELVSRVFAALSARDSAALLELCRIDMRSELVGYGRTQRSRDGFAEQIMRFWGDPDTPALYEHEIVCVAGDYAVVTWRTVPTDSRGDPGIRDAPRGVALVRSRAGRLDLFRSYEAGAELDEVFRGL